MSVMALGLNHNSAPLDLRGRFALAADQLVPTLQAFRRRLSPMQEAAIVSTCNRTELYVSGDAELAAPALDWFAGVGGVSHDTLHAHGYVLEDAAAARHAFSVASGLDSMVIGEPQILGQMKQAMRHAEQAGTLGTTLHQMFQRSFAVAKEVRSATQIGAHSVSLAAAAVRLASQLFEDLGRTKVLFIGAGEMIDLAAAHFGSRKPQAMAVANRSADRGALLASRHGAEALPLSLLPQRLAEFDIVVSCTASTLPIIGLGAVERALKARRNRPMFMVDLAVPRDIEGEVSRLSNVYLYTLDDLATLVQQGGDKRQAAVQQAQGIVECGVRDFVQWLDQRACVPLIKSLNQRADAWRVAEMNRARKMLARGENVDAVLDALARGLTQKLMHGALSELNAASGDSRAQLSRTLSRLYLRGSAVGE
jgi:glutamyl-tRNA reductase